VTRPDPDRVDAAAAERRWPRLVIAGAALAAIVLLGSSYPLGPAWLFLGVAAYGAMLWWRPALWLVAVPTLLPTLDLMRWTGSIALGESDFVVLATVAVLALRAPVRLRPDRLSLPLLLLGILALSDAASTVRGLLPFPPIDANSFNTYLSPYNALRIAKGFVEAALLLPFLVDALQTREGCRRLALGMACGLAGVGAIVVVERLLYVDLFDFTTIFRVTGPFMTMHVGGGQLGGFLMLATPFLASVAGTAARRRWVLALALGALCLAVYAMVVSFDRTTDGAAVAMLLTLVVASAISAQRGGRLVRLVVYSIVGGLALVPLPAAVLFSPFMHLRMSLLGEDIDNRLALWDDGLALRDRSWASDLLGMGIGTFPRLYEQRSDNEPPTRFSIEREGDRRYLHVGSGLPLYIGQLVAIRPHRRYKLAIEFRATSEAAVVPILICEKNLLYSLRCLRIVVRPTTPNAWERYSTEFGSRRLGQGRHLHRPVELAVASAPAGTGYDVAMLSLMAADEPAGNEIARNEIDRNGIAEPGEELLANGDFSRGMARWLFTDDFHANWRIENQSLMILFEQGWLGLLAIGAVVAAGVVRLLRRIVAGDPAASSLLAALVGFGVVSLFNSLLEAPRLATLFYLVLFAGLVTPRPERDAPHPPTGDVAHG
jgi:O-antigen ligase